MRTGVAVYLRPTDRKRLRAIVDDRNSPQKHVWRARIVLAAAVRRRSTSASWHGRGDGTWASGGVSAPAPSVRF